METWDDAELVRRVGDGSSEAEAEICRRMAPRIRLYGLRHLRSEEAADDLVQHALFELISALRDGRPRDPCRLAQFALGISRNSVLALRRDAQRRARALDDLRSQERRDDVSEAVDVDTDRLRWCMQALAERERSVVVLAWYDETSIAEAAGLLATSEGNIRVIRHRALRQLRTCMGAEA